MKVNNLASAFCFQLLMSLSAVYSLAPLTEDCLNVPNGNLTATLYSDESHVHIDNIHQIACICQTVLGANNILTEEFSGVRGALIPADCGALRFFARVSKAKHLPTSLKRCGD